MRGKLSPDCPGANAAAVAELALALTLAVMRRVVSLDRRLRAGEVLQSIDHLGHGVRGKTVGVVGMGSTARCTAELFHVSPPLLTFLPSTLAHPSSLRSTHVCVLW